MQWRRFFCTGFKLDPASLLSCTSFKLDPTGFLSCTSFKLAYCSRFL